MNYICAMKSLYQHYTIFASLFFKFFTAAYNIFHRIFLACGSA